MRWMLMVWVVLLFIITMSETRSETIVVDDDGGSWADYTNIQDAINGSSDGDTIRVYGGTYSETLCVIKQLSILGNESEYATIDGLGNEVIINISTDNCSMAYFRIGNGSVWGDGISITANHTVIYNISLYDVHRSILVWQSTNCTINNIILINGNVAAEVILSDIITIQNGIFITGNGVIASFSKEIIFHNLTFGNGYNGVKVYFCVNVSISQITVNRCQWGIEIDSSTSTIVSDSIAGYNVNAGIIITDSNNISVVNNVIPFNFWGVFIYSSVECDIQDNEFAGCGVIIYGDYLEEWNTHDIGLTNTVNDKPLRYLKNINESLVSSDAGQVILANCTYIRVEDINIDQCSVGIQLGFTDFSTISNNTVNGSVYGISLFYSWENQIHNNTIRNGIHGVKFDISNYNTIQFNNIYDNNGYAIQIDEECEDNWIYQNNFTTNHKIPQAIDDGVDNTWYRNGIGNYWSDHTVPDVDSNGIVDDPYRIDGGADSSDYFPLTNPPSISPETNDEENGSPANYALQLIRILVIVFFIAIAVIIIVNMIRQKK